MRRILDYRTLPNKIDVTWKDVKWAALDPEKSPLTEIERTELETLKDNDDQFFKRMWEMLKNDIL